MIRDFSQLTQESFDLLVIGGGVYGAWTALDAALRGLKTAVVDKGDWASGTSMASTKLIHGGLRYLEQLRLDLVHTSLEERKRLTVIAPHRVLPLRFVIPLYEDNRVGPLKLKTGLWLYDLMAGKGQPVPPHTHLSRKEVTDGYGFLADEKISGGFAYGDCQTDDFRMVLDIVDGARRAGATAVNYAQAVSLLSSGRRVVGAVVKDILTGSQAEVRADVVVNAAGPWVPEVDDIHLLSSSVRYSKGVHLVMPPLPTKDALLLMTGNDNRIFFIVPWYGKSLLGTTDSPYEGDPDQVTVAAGDIDYLLQEANRHLKGIHWDRDAVLGGFAGLRTLQNEPGKALSQVTREWLVMEPRPGLLVSIGGKFTSARIDAAKMVEKVLELLQRPSKNETPTTTYTLPTSPRSDFKAWRKTAMQQALKKGVDKDVAAFLVLRFGESIYPILEEIAGQPELARRIAPGLPFCWAEVMYCAAHEMTVHLDDLLRRRIPLTILSQADRKLAEKIARTVAPVLGWKRGQQKKEVERLMAQWVLP